MEESNKKKKKSGIKQIQNNINVHRLVTEKKQNFS